MVVLSAFLFLPEYQYQVCRKHKCLLSSCICYIPCINCVRCIQLCLQMLLYSRFGCRICSTSSRIGICRIPVFIHCIAPSVEIVLVVILVIIEIIINNTGRLLQLLPAPVNTLRILYSSSGVMSSVVVVNR